MPSRRSEPKAPWWRRTRALVAAFALAVLGAQLSPAHAREVVERERAEVPEPAPVSHRGTRYEAVQWGRARGLPQNGGYVAAFDAKTGAERWLVKVYDAPPDDGREQDKQDVFITDLKLDREARHLIVENERGGVYRVNLRTRAVRTLKRGR